MESLTLTSTRSEIDVADLPPNVREVTVAGEIRLPVGTRMEDAEREIIRRTVEAYPTSRKSRSGAGNRAAHAPHEAGGLGLRPAPGPRPADPAVREGSRAL